MSSEDGRSTWGISQEDMQILFMDQRPGNNGILRDDWTPANYTSNNSTGHELRIRRVPRRGYSSVRGGCSFTRSNLIVSCLCKQNTRLLRRNVRSSQ